MPLNFPNQQNFLAQSLLNMPAQFQQTESDIARKKAQILSGLEEKMLAMTTSDEANVYPSRDEWFAAYRRKSNEMGVQNAAPSDILGMYDAYSQEHTRQKVDKLNKYMYDNRAEKPKKITKALNNDPAFQEWFGSISPEMQMGVMQNTGYDPYTENSKGLLGSSLAVPIGVGGYYGGKYALNKFKDARLNTLKTSPEFATAEEALANAQKKLDNVKPKSKAATKRGYANTVKNAKARLAEMEAGASGFGKASTILKSKGAAFAAPFAGKTVGEFVGGEAGGIAGQAAGAGYLGARTGKSFMKFLAGRFPQIAAKAGATAMLDSPGVAIMDVVGLGIAAKDIYDAYQDFQNL